MIREQTPLARQVCFSHGKESGPWGTKIRALAEVSRRAEWAVESLDYQGMDDPHARVARLVEWCNKATGPYLLVGSSMGGHVTAAAAHAVAHPPIGMFLIAPAFYMPGYEALTPPAPACPVTIVHGWSDSIVPWKNSVRFAQAQSVTLVLLPGDHGFIDALDHVCRQFEQFLLTLS